MVKAIPLAYLQKPFNTGECAIHGLSLRGNSHEACSMPLQDSFAAAQLNNGWIVLAVADGVGSEPRSDIGAQLAVSAVVNHINRFRGYLIDDQSMKFMLESAFHAACADIYEQAIKDKAPLHEYSTTLHAVIFSDGLLYIMHAGDGGVAIITEEGEYKKLTAPMKDCDGESVVPLMAGPDTWQFIVSQDRAQSVIVATDGVWDKLCPAILEGFGYESGIEKSIATFFLSPWAREWSKESLEDILEKEKCIFRADIKDAVTEFYNTLVSALAQGNDTAEAETLVKKKIAPGNIPVTMLRGIKDDITLLTLVRYQPRPQQIDLQSFSAPDWEAISLWASNHLYGYSSSPQKQVQEEMYEETADSSSQSKTERSSASCQN